MRILVVSDLHYTLRQLDWVASVAGDYEIVVVAGDLLDIASAVDPDAQIAVVLEYLARLADKTTVVVCSGNHDLNATNDLEERAPRWLEAATSSGVLIDFSHLELDGVLISVCAYWDGPRTRERVGQQLDDDAARVGDRLWVWAYHAPPDASPTSWTGSRHYGDEDLSRWIAQHQPDIVLCGHVHESPFVEGGRWVDRIGRTSVFNAGRQIGPVPTCIEIDTDRLTARWSSEETVEEHALAETVS
jgi:Icc-related predicted phosphoesterase